MDKSTICNGKTSYLYGHFHSKLLTSKHLPEQFGPFRTPIPSPNLHSSPARPGMPLGPTHGASPGLSSLSSLSLADNSSSKNGRISIEILQRKKVPNVPDDLPDDLLIDFNLRKDLHRSPLESYRSP